MVALLNVLKGLGPAPIVVLVSEIWIGDGDQTKFNFGHWAYLKFKLCKGRVAFLISTPLEPFSSAS